MTDRERSKFPVPAVVSKALKRDFGIITGGAYIVRSGLKNITAPYVAVVGWSTHQADIRKACDLEESMTARGWNVRRDENYIYIDKAPTKAEAITHQKSNEETE